MSNNNSNYSGNENANFGLNMESISGQNSSSRNITTNNLNNNDYFNGAYYTQANNNGHVTPQIVYTPIFSYNPPIQFPVLMVPNMNTPSNYGNINISPNNYNIPNININRSAFNSNNLSTIYNAPQNEIIKQSKKDKEDFIDFINNNYSLSMIQENDPEKFNQLFSEQIDIINEKYEEENKKRDFKIYIKKINNKYVFDYYKFQDYKIQKNFDLISEYLAEKKYDEKEINNMSEKMKKEFINYRNFKLFIFNEFCFLSFYTISVYIPHVLKVEHKNTFLTHFLKNKDLEMNDFIIELDDNENSLFIKILELRLSNLKNNNYLNSNEFGLSINTTGDKGFLYTTIPTDLIERCILEIDLNTFKNKYIGGYSSKKNSTIRNSFICNNNEDNRTFFEKNEDYLRGMTTQELILFFIFHELIEYIKLPRLIIYENLLDLKGNKIYINKQLNFIEFDSIIQSKKTFIYNSEFPIRIQKFFEIDKKNVINKTDINNSNFIIEENDIYFFEVKTSLMIEKIENILLNIIKNFQEFYQLFIKNKMIEEKNTPNIILIYDFHKVEFDFETTLKRILNRIKNEIKFNIQIIYCFPNYSYFSFGKLNTDLKEMQKLQLENKQQNQEQIQALKDQNQKEIQALKEQNQKEIQALKEQNQKEIQTLKEQNQKEIQALKDQNQKIMEKLKELNNSSTS